MAGAGKQVVDGRPIERARRIVALLLVAAAHCCAQSYSVLDTLYTLGVNDGGPLTASIYIPSRPNGVGVVLTHGYTGTRQTLKLWCDTLASNGYVAMAIDYHDFSNATYGIFPRPVREHKLAVEFLRRNAARFGVLGGRVAGFGQSEGSYHWAEAITWDNDDAYFGTDPAIDDRLDCAVFLYGMYDQYSFLQSGIPFNSLYAHYFSADTSARRTKGNSLANVARVTTPVLLLHGTSDQTVQYQQTVEFHDSLVAHGKTAPMKLFSGQPHLFEFTSSLPQKFTAAGLVAKDTVLAFLLRSTQITAAEEAGEAVPRSFSLEQNYPNPFNPATTIEFQLGQAGAVRLEVFDLLGRKVATIFEGQLPPGRHRRTWDAGTLGSGMYLYRLTAGGLARTGRLLLVR